MSEAHDFYCRIPGNWLTDPSLCWFEWQALIGSLFAVLAGGGTIYFLWMQISQSARHEADRLRRQHNAARATLPLTLSGLCEAMRQMLLALHEAKSEVVRDGYASSFSSPVTPSDHIEELQAIISSTDEPTVLEPISQIIREIQTLWSRVRMLRDQREQMSWSDLSGIIDDWLIQAAQIYALIESLFEYGRSVSDKGPKEVAWERAESIIFKLSIEGKTLEEKIRASLKLSPNFWSLK